MHGLNQLDVEGLMTIDDNTKAVIQILIDSLLDDFDSECDCKVKR